MRVIFIPGFGENETIFNKIAPELPGEKLFLSFWKLLPNKSIKNLQVTLFAKELIKEFTITKNDLIIGHSAGGWVALHIKNIIGCPIVQIASWWDEKKVVTFTTNRHLVYFAAKWGLYFNQFILRHIMKKYYKGKPSQAIFEAVFIRLITGNRANVVNQLRLIFNLYPVKLSVKPDLSIHAKGDTIIRFPDGAVYEVAGDHFSLYTYPEQVYPPILNFIHHATK